MRLIVSKYLMENELGNSKIYKGLSRFVIIYAIINPILAALNVYFASKGKFNISMIIAGSISIFTVSLAFLTSAVFRRTLGKKFSGLYIKNVIFF